MGVRSEYFIVLFWLQWRIQDFPGGGHQVGVLTYYFVHFWPKTA